ncbi:MAG: PBP1A family penicillin-binding protein [Oscillospiraceae bacterium]|nr:PBP1A family penicillin-binding protein [Oscillospiraceae bacterium]
MSGKRVKKKEKKGHSMLRALGNFFIGTILLALIIGTGIIAGMYVAVAQEMEDLNIKEIAHDNTSFIYFGDENGNYQQLDHLYDESNRIWVDSENIPKAMKDAVVSIEDERFYSHFGVDIKRSTGAFINWCMGKMGLKHASYGGSTITQQVIKNITKEGDKKASRKIKEMLRAIALEREMSKDEILTTYLNIVYFANNCYGVQAASHVYYNKDVSELTLAQTASIAGITQRPSTFDPFKYPEKNTEKRNLVLKKMYELNKITQAEYEEAINEEFSVTNEYKAKKAEVSSYFVDQVINDVLADLQEKKGFSETYAKQLLYGGGLKIYTTMDPYIQADLEEVFTNMSNFPKVKGGTSAQSAMIVIDPYNGAVKGLVGGLGKKVESRGFIRTSQLKRQPGSSIKPLSVYAPALEDGKITPATIVKDEPVTFGSWSPHNSYSGFKGNMIVRTAVEISSNIPAVKVLSDLGINTSFLFMKNKLQFGSLVDEDKNLSSLALGGLTKGVSPQEMAAAYSIFVNGGEYRKPYTYTKVLDASGKILLENDGKPTRVISESTAYIMADLLYSVVNDSSGTGKAAKLSNMPTYGKTGTTNDDKDRWFVGFTPYYVAAVWYGFDKPASIKDAGVTYNPATKAWNIAMTKIHASLPEKQLNMPDGIVAEEICTVTGNIAKSGCPSHTEYFKPASKPKDTCSSRHNGSDTVSLPQSEGIVGIEESNISIPTLPPHYNTNNTMPPAVLSTNRPEQPAYSPVTPARTAPPVSPEEPQKRTPVPERPGIVTPEPNTGQESGNSPVLQKTPAPEPNEAAENTENNIIDLD